LGAQRVEWTYPEDADFVVLADTEGNLFCVIAKRPQGCSAALGPSYIKMAI
jgi:hypothetical protein